VTYNNNYTEPNIDNGITVSRKNSEVIGNTFTPDWSKNTHLCYGGGDHFHEGTTRTRRSTVEHFNIPLNYKELQHLTTGDHSTLHHQLKERLGIDLHTVYDIDRVWIAPHNTWEPIGKGSY
jgi:hypothetical protein